MYIQVINNMFEDSKNAKEQVVTYVCIYALFSHTQTKHCHAAVLVPRMSISDLLQQWKRKYVWLQQYKGPRVYCMHVHTYMYVWVYMLIT